MARDRARAWRRLAPRDAARPHYPPAASPRRQSRLRSSREEEPDAPFEGAARDQHAMSADEAADADIGAEPEDAPVEAAAGMLFAQMHHVVDAQFHHLRWAVVWRLDCRTG